MKKVKFNSITFVEDDTQAHVTRGANVNDLIDEVTQLREQLNEAEATVAKFMGASEYDKGREVPAGDEAHCIWAQVVDKPHWALPTIQDVIIERDRAKRSREHTEYWYSIRIERLRDLLKGTKYWAPFNGIVANGTVDGHEPPTYAQQLNIAKHQAKRAEKERAEARAECDMHKNKVQKIAVTLANVRDECELATKERDKARRNLAESERLFSDKEWEVSGLRASLAGARDGATGVRRYADRMRPVVEAACKDRDDRTGGTRLATHAAVDTYRAQQGEPVTTPKTSVPSDGGGPGSIPLPWCKRCKATHGFGPCPTPASGAPERVWCFIGPKGTNDRGSWQVGVPAIGGSASAEYVRADIAKRWQGKPNPDHSDTPNETIYVGDAGEIGGTEVWYSDPDNVPKCFGAIKYIRADVSHDKAVEAARREALEAAADAATGALRVWWGNGHIARWNNPLGKAHDAIRAAILGES